jgi:hypothetical protein
VTKYVLFKIIAEKDDEIIEFSVKGTSHIQHIWNETFINDLTKNGEKRIFILKQKGYRIYTEINNRVIKVLN